MKNKILIEYDGRKININNTLYTPDPISINAYLKMAELVNQYSSSINHPNKLGDCLLCKLNIIDKRQIRKNPYYVKKQN